MCRRLVPFVVALSLALVSSAASAQTSNPPEVAPPEPTNNSGFHLAANLGFSKFFNGGPTAFALDIFPGYALGNGLVLEGHVGVHTGGNVGVVYNSGRGAVVTSAARSTYLPFLFGARYQMDVGDFRPFVATHFGVAVTRFPHPGLCNNNGNCTQGRFAFDIGTGAEYLISDAVGVGAAFWYHAAPGPGTVVQLVTFGPHASFLF